MAAEGYTLELFPTSEESWANQWGALGNPKSDEAELRGENAGFDLFLHKKMIVGPTPFAKALEMGTKARMIRNSDGAQVHQWMVPRSSIWKKNLVMANSVGVIDKGQRGQLLGMVQQNKDAPEPSVTLNNGERQFQILAPDMGPITRVRLLKEDRLDVTERGEGGFGSTGR